MSLVWVSGACGVLVSEGFVWTFGLYTFYTSAYFSSFGFLLFCFLFSLPSTVEIYSLAFCSSFTYFFKDFSWSFIYFFKDFSSSFCFYCKPFSCSFYVTFAAFSSSFFFYLSTRLSSASFFNSSSSLNRLASSLSWAYLNICCFLSSSSSSFFSLVFIKFFCF